MFLNNAPLTMENTVAFAPSPQRQGHDGHNRGGPVVGHGSQSETDVAEQSHDALDGAGRQKVQKHCWPPMNPG
jgi:hypothetical protein